METKKETRYSVSPCMVISDEIDDAMIAIHETTILEIKATILCRGFFRNKGYYMPARGYEFSPQLFNLISHK